MMVVIVRRLIIARRPTRVKKRNGKETGRVWFVFFGKETSPVCTIEGKRPKRNERNAEDAEHATKRMEIV